MIHYHRYLFVKMKVFNYSELHFFEGTFYKIHTLVSCLSNGRDQDARKSKRLCILKKFAKVGSFGLMETYS